MAEFEVEFTVETNQWYTYENFIVALRGRLGDRTSHGRPVLPLQEPIRWFDIVLRTNNRSIRLRIRRGNLYLDGYQMQNQQWLEFGSSNDPQLIPGSSFLGFKGDYTSLASVAGQVLGTTLGKDALINAVNELAITTIWQIRARSLIVVIQMFCESTRFIPISDRLNNASVNASVMDWMLDLERSWGTLSEAVLRADADPETKLPPNNLLIPPNTTITTITDAVAILGILLGLWVIPRPSGTGRVPHMAVKDGIGECQYGRPLVEVFSVRINNIDGEKPGDLYGTITITDGLDLQYIYNRSRDNYESIKPGENAFLTGPARSISACQNFTIKVLLMDKDSDPSPNNEVSNGEISWYVFNTANEYNKPLSSNVDGKYGSVTVNYVVLSDAVLASVELTLINGDGEDPANVYGSLTATNGDFGDSKIVLFQKTSDEYINVSPGQLIPLSRSVVAVPLNSSLVVGANLYDYDSLSTDDEIANGTAELPAQLFGTSEGSIFGKYGEIRVKVTWI